MKMAMTASGGPTTSTGRIGNGMPNIRRAQKMSLNNQARMQKLTANGQAGRAQKAGLNFNNRMAKKGWSGSAW